VVASKDEQTTTTKKVEAAATTTAAPGQTEKVFLKALLSAPSYHRI